MHYKVNSIKEYVEAIPQERKEMVLKLIALVNKYFPEIEGNMEYKMPTYNPVCAFASQKHYISIYIYNHKLIDKYRDELGKLKVGKCCIRFSKMEQFPESTIRKILAEMVEKNS